ncbi:hypothetical protein WI40_11490 [Burkholderia ubonensis]|nr:hypothetical protein WI40_11490 [Burkholderia ubonensis]KVC54080.1 hypothetical protein WI72_19620 [Burkholderia ubonensis]
MHGWETIPYSRCQGRSICWAHLEPEQVSAMKTLLLIAGVAALLSGCVVAPYDGYYGGGYYGGGYYHHHHHRDWD